MKYIYVGGDFFQDIFNIGELKHTKRFNMLRTEKRAGGASNTFYNLTQIIQNCNDIQVYNCNDNNKAEQNALIRFNDINSDNKILEYWEINNNNLNSWYRYPKYISPTEPTVLIISEYNKGFCSQQIPDDLACNLLIIDSRYKTIPIDQLYTKTLCKIWHCTGNEYDVDWKDWFDWTIWTNNADTIKLISNSNFMIEIPVPKIEIVDCVGAGDTFTAAIAAYLTKYYDWDSFAKQIIINNKYMKDSIHWRTLIGKPTEETMIKAIEFGIRAAQDVCKTKYTAITNIKLE